MGNARSGSWSPPPWSAGRTTEAVSKVGRKSKSCHDSGWGTFSCPHPNPLPLGEGAIQRPLLKSPRPSGEGAIQRPLLKSPRPSGEGQGEGTSCYDRCHSLGFETASTPMRESTAERLPPHERSLDSSSLIINVSQPIFGHSSKRSPGKGNPTDHKLY